ncbi:SCO family protein [Noviherbaspirillum suwonense]|jgi:protein SCO1/2|uniref:Protein SCO1/2 n=1 Tax=Noviherbaspirillum suwonense TaxID=1224511 RepID=A0ABY1Q3M4_9BURK|nr:SCO family protein [Noviherbaspirillum suwonense]SMP58294.1 protein SCO1/2 [Noviherbaspirillum suwonense]
MNSKRLFLKGGLVAAPALALTAALKPAPAGAAVYFPNTVLQTHDGRKVRFYDDLLKGKLVVINMMYTVCTGVCPANTASLKAVQQALGPRVGRDIFMYSLSLRPEFDSPEALRDYVRQYDIGPGWTFLTGAPQDMEVLRRKLGFYDSDPVADADISNHTGVVRIGNLPAERWCMVPAQSSTSQIVTSILGAA